MLTDQFETEQMRLKEAQKLVADIKEELAIAEGRVKQAYSERDKIQSKAKEFIHKIQKLTDASQDKDDKIGQLNATIEILNSDKAYVKKSYDILLAKCQKMQDENILIPKKSSNEEESKGKHSSKSPSKQTMESIEQTTYL